MIGEKYDKKEKINQFKEQAFEYFVNKLQSSQENIKELLFDQFGLTDKKIDEFSKITNEKLNEIQNQNQVLSDQNIYMIEQNRTIKKLLSSAVSEKSLNVESVPTLNGNKCEDSQSFQHPQVANNGQDIKFNSSKLTKLQIDKKKILWLLYFSENQHCDFNIAIDIITN